MIKAARNYNYSSGDLGIVYVLGYCVLGREFDPGDFVQISQSDNEFLFEMEIIYKYVDWNLSIIPLKKTFNLGKFWTFDPA